MINRPFWETHWWTISSQTQAELKQAIALAAQGEFVRYEVDVLGANNRVITIDFLYVHCKTRQAKLFC
ncbi:hypothetical protein ANSO36C_13400 [Nostoc cf. commune SO-36]|uniref:Uncharacterized protein n=1 Tax=Nostoc cf. commune SO-36 TaxID=449208 RepID=A0ABN6PWX3_NOSCO|nr:hypothetical protein [Nostoc commune]BDI15538.1 hypothetical protein ANSO36C_13400 [Nostoc cf. commune SO-36]